MGTYIICDNAGAIKHEGLRLVDAFVMTKQYNEQSGTDEYEFMGEDAYLARFVGY